MNKPYKIYFLGAATFTLILMLTACDPLWPLENPYDQKLCNSACVEDRACYKGQCIDLTNGYVYIVVNTFSMGSPNSETCRRTGEDKHDVTLTRGYELKLTEVTQGQFASIMGYNPSYFSKSCGSDCPVEMVNWHEAVAYCNKLSQKKGLTECFSCLGSKASVSCQEASAYSGQNIYSCPGYRLPTEAEWEHAYRSGTRSPLYNGDIEMCRGSDANADKIAWYYENSGEKTNLIAQKTPNAWGLFDMAGNVSEWCHDWYSLSLGLSPNTDPVGESSASKRVIRGGSYYFYAEELRAASRKDLTPSYRFNDVGFRCARTLKKKSGEDNH